MNKDPKIPIEKVKSLVSYSLMTGDFTNLVARGGLKAGQKLLGRSKKGYIVITLSGYKIYAHRLAWFYITGSWPKSQIDHRDTVKHNNSFLNLRESTNAQNQTNVPTYGKTLPRGVSKISTKPGWFMAQIVINYKKQYLGTFPTPEEAHEAYKAKHLELHGEFSIYFKEVKREAEVA